jgi:dTDP-4-amino-4,6-dideoxygalactose transaminase
MTIPLFVNQPALEPLMPRIAERLRAVLDAGRYILGPEVEAFESEFAGYLGVRHCVGVGNGTDALTIALRSLGVSEGDEVVVPAVTFYATAEAVVNAGGSPVFCDVDERTWCMTAATAEAVVTERTRLLLPVHLFGNPAPIAELAELAERHGLRILGDAAQSAGAKLDDRSAGSLGDAACFSFYPSKNLGGIGDGGAIDTDDDEVAAIARRLRFHGSDDKRIYTDVGYNSRLDELQAAALRVLLEHLDAWTATRRAAAAAYSEAGLGELVEVPTETDGAESCFHLYVVLAAERDRLAASLADAGIGCRAYYEPPLHRQPAMAPFAGPAPLPAADRFGDRNLALPMGHALTADDARTVVEVVREALS